MPLRERQKIQALLWSLFLRTCSRSEETGPSYTLKGTRESSVSKGNSLFAFFPCQLGLAGQVVEMEGPEIGGRIAMAVTGNVHVEARRTGPQLSLCRLQVFFRHVDP